MFGSFSLRYLFLLFTISLIFSFRIRKLNKVKPLYAVDKWLLTGNEESQQKRTITVRFINNISGKDVVTEAEEGSILLAVGDRAGVKLPRACRTGLCGSCTCELQDPAAIATSTNPRDGFATIRACSYKCHVPEGMDEMVIDVYRMKNRAVAATSKTNSKVAGVSLVNDYVSV
jgi:ferredoxin